MIVRNFFYVTIVLHVFAFAELGKFLHILS